MGGFMSYKHNVPILCRIRNCMQYANTLEDYVDMLKKDNAREYAKCWLRGDRKMNERVRMGLVCEFVIVER